MGDNCPECKQPGGEHFNECRTGEVEHYRNRVAELERERRAGCPCMHTAPCDPRCTCVQPLSSAGCSRCCTYGSAEQQRAAAARLARADAAEARERALREAGRALVGVYSKENCERHGWALSVMEEVAWLEFARAMVQAEEPTAHTGPVASTTEKT